MDLVFDIASSVEFWRRRYPGDRMPSAASFAFPGDCASRKQDVSALMPSWVDDNFLAPTGGVFHALDTSGNQGRRTDSLVVHQWKGSVPEGSFYRLYENVLVQTPGFMFLNAATLLDYPSLIAFGDELCGRYSFDAREERGFRKRKQPLATKKLLGNFLQLAHNHRGCDKATRALMHVVDGSASPMETLDEMTMCLPYRNGGYGILQPAMNAQIVLSPKAARIAKRRKCFLDMAYIDFNLDVEHHGKYDHTIIEDVSSDRARVNALREMGFVVIELTSEQVGDLFAYEYIIEQIAGIVGKRLRKDKLGATQERMALRKALYSWNGSSGRIR